MLAKYLPDLWGLDSIALFLFMNKKDSKIQITILMLRQGACFPETLRESNFLRLCGFEFNFIFCSHAKHAENFSKEIWQVQAILGFKKQFQVVSMDILQNRPCKIQNAALIFTDGKHCYLRSLTKHESNRYLRNGQ